MEYQHRSGRTLLNLFESNLRVQKLQLFQFAPSAKTLDPPCDYVISSAFFIGIEPFPESLLGLSIVLRNLGKGLTPASLLQISARFHGHWIGSTMLPIAFPIVVSIAITVLLLAKLGQLLRTEGGSTTITLGFDPGCRSTFTRP